MTEERKKYIRNHGKWFDVRAKGFGSVYIRAIIPGEALAEAAKRWNLNVEEMRDFTVREVEI